jgi:hypothetical protein
MKKFIWLKKLTPNQKFLIGILVIIILVGMFFLVFTYLARDKGLVARVNGTAVTATTLNEKLTYVEHFYIKSGQPYSKQTLRQQTLDNIVNMVLMQQYAQKNNINIDEAINDLYQQRLQSYPNEQALLEQIQDLYGMNKGQYLNTLKEDALRNIVSERTQKSISSWLTEQQNISQIDIF